jgi:sugar lactone lactonase YvrE
MKTRGKQIMVEMNRIAKLIYAEGGLVRAIAFTLLILGALQLAACSATEAAPAALQESADAEVSETPAAEPVEEAAAEYTTEPTAVPTEIPATEPTLESAEGAQKDLSEADAKEKEHDSEEANGQRVEMVASFDPTRMQLPEGIAMDENQNMYVSVGVPGFLPDMEYFGELWKIDRDGNHTLLHEIDGPGAAGMAVDASGVVYYAYPGDEATRGVYRVTDDGRAERLPGTENVILANGITVDEQGDLLVTDSILGAVWRVPSDGSGAAEIWFQHELLTGCPEDPVGANGIAFGEHNQLYVGSTVRGLLMHVSVEDDGAAGEAELIAGRDDCDGNMDELDSIDGIIVGEDGSVYALLVIRNELVRIDIASGEVELLLDASDGLHNPASIVFDPSSPEQDRLFFTNYAVLPPVPEATFGPSVLSYRTTEEK